MGSILNFIRKPVSRDVIINTLGNYLNVFFTAFFALLLVRILDPTQYGVLSVLLGIAYVLANILDFGTTATIYSYLPPLLEKKSFGVYKLIKTTFFYQSVFAFGVITILLVVFPYLDRVFFKTDAPPLVLYLTIFSVLFFIWQNFVLNILYAAKKIFKANLYLNLANALKTVVIFALMTTRTVTVGSIIFVFGIVGPLIFFLLLFIEKRDLVFILLKSKVTREEFKLSYALTYFIATQFYNLGLRMDLFLLSYLRTKPEVGFYGLSQKIILTIITTVISVTQVLSPGFSKVKNRREALHQLKHGFLYLLMPTGLFVLLLLTPNQIFSLVFTDKFGQTAVITKSLVFPFIIYTLANLPILFILYSVKKPMYILVSNILFFIVMTLGSYFFIQKYGVFGPAYAISLALLFPVIILSFATFREYKKLPR